MTNDIAYLTAIRVQAQFRAQHRWKECPIDEVAHLRNWHRHCFHVAIQVWVAHGDREKEFFVCQRQLREFLQGHWEGGQWDKSCEMFAEDLLRHFALGLGWEVQMIEVSEDGENAALVFPVSARIPAPQMLFPSTDAG